MSDLLVIASSGLNAFHVIGALTALWALLLSFVGIKREGFPATRRSEIGVALVSIVMFVLAVGSAIYTSLHEEEEGEDPAGPTALVHPPR
ncbi:MAG: hypothetical protein H0V85_00100 [Thermoleophilaceae bacterium]|nr:hypothetical protein [Thermoleophilaceae bacterium]